MRPGVSPDQDKTCAFKVKLFLVFPSIQLTPPNYKIKNLLQIEFINQYSNCK